MCGRFTQFKNLETIADRYGVEVPEGVLTPRYNAAPTQKLPVIIVERGKRKLEMMR